MGKVNAIKNNLPSDDLAPLDFTVRLSDREDQSTIRKTQSLSIPFTPLSVNQTLAGRITPNYLIQIQNLVGQILVQLNRIADKDRSQVEELKTKYKKTTFESSRFQREIASYNLKSACAAFGASFLQFLSPYQSDREILNLFAKEVCPKLGEMLGSNLQVNMHQATSLANLLLNEYQAKASNKGSTDATKQEILDLLNKVLTSLKEAARAG